MTEDCWELWIYTTWKHRYFLYWLWISYKYIWIFLFVLCFCYCCCYYFYFLNNRSSCLAPEWFFVSSRETVGLWPENNNRNVFITRVTAGDDYCFFFVKRKCYRELNVLSNWFKGAFLENKVLSLCFIFPVWDLGLLYHRKDGGLHYFCCDKKNCKVFHDLFHSEDWGEIKDKSSQN